MLLQRGMRSALVARFADDRRTSAKRTVKMKILLLIIAICLPSTVLADLRVLDMASVDKDGFPETITTNGGSQGATIIWRRMYRYADVYGNNPDVALTTGRFLLTHTDGVAIVYTAAGPSMKPGTELTPNEVLRTLIDHVHREVRPDSALPPGQPGQADAYYALVIKKRDQFLVLPLNFDEDTPAHIYTMFPIWDLLSRFDEMNGTYLIFNNFASFTALSWDRQYPSWEHFHAWWYDPKKGQLIHVVLPESPWVRDAKLDSLLLRELRNAPCGIECGRRWEITKVARGSIFVSIFGEPTAIHESVTGTYELPAGAVKWVKLK